MQKMLQFVPVQLTLFLILGIITGYYFHIDNIITIALIGVLWVVLCILYYYANKTYQPRGYFNFTTYLIFYVVGVTLVIQQKEIHKTSHYSHYLLDENTVVFEVSEVLKPSNYYLKYVAEVNSLNGERHIGKLLVNIKKEDSLILNVDDRVYLKTKFKTIGVPLNPFQFDYRNYLAKQQIYHQIYGSSLNMLVIEHSNWTLKGFAARLRNSINEALKKYGFDNDELGVINALLLGQRNGISKKLLQNYANAGAIHILAVSGLHVGIILLLLNFLFKPLTSFKNGKTVRLIVVVSLLWLFAFIAGLSASVVRAVTMFSAVAIGWQVNRASNVFNTLFISMFFLLLIHPFFLFDVGFQLSYLAVFSIVWLQPLLGRMWKPSYKLLRYIWNLLTVTVAAQIGVLPLSIYYFHQFPGLFFLSSLIIIPVLGFVLVGGILVIVLSYSQMLPDWMAYSYRGVIKYLNAIVEWISSKEAFLFQDISISTPLLFVLYALIVSLFVLIEKRRFNSAAAFLVSILLIQLVVFQESKESRVKGEFIVFHKTRHSIIGERKGNEMKVFHTLDSSKVSQEKILKQYKLGEKNVNLISNRFVPSVYRFEDKVILVVDSLGVYTSLDFKPDIVVLQQSPKINLNRLIEKLNPQQIIADGSNYKSYVQHWKEVCIKRKTPFHDTSKKGAFILSD